MNINEFEKITNKIEKGKGKLKAKESIFKLFNAMGNSFMFAGGFFIGNLVSNVLPIADESAMMAGGAFVWLGISSFLSKRIFKRQRENLNDKIEELENERKEHVFS